jgi:NTE family protein
MKKEKKVGIALGGGGARGLAHIGVLRVLDNAGIKVDAIAGVSMGAVVGAAYSLGMSLDEMEEIANFYSKKRNIARILDFSISRTSFIKGVKVKQFFNKVYDNKTFVNFKIPVYIVVTNLETGEEEILSKGSVAEAVRASSAVPGIFPPVKIHNNYYIDGGVVNPTPIDVLHNAGMDVIIGVDLVMKRNLELKNPSITSTLLQSYEIIRTLAVKYKLSSTNTDAILLKPDLRGAIDSFRFHELNRFIRAGEEAAEKALPEILKRLL